MRIAIITARGGSKRIPKKNIKLFLGKPIIQYSIEAALNSNYFDEVMVSTDDEEIASISKKMGAVVPFFRSKENSDDYSTTCDVLEEVLLKYKELGKNVDYFCCIYPTAPFVNSDKLINAMDLLINSNADCVLPVVEYSYPIQRSLKCVGDNIVMKWPENYFSRSQDLEKTYHDCGQYYCMKTSSLLTQMKLFAENTIPIITSEIEVQDIDNETDWLLAELKYQFIHSK